MELDDMIGVADGLLWALETTEQTGPMVEHSEMLFHASETLIAYDSDNASVKRFAYILGLEALLSVPTETLGTMLQNAATQLHQELSADVWSARRK
jgi:hypothetical protein